MSRLIYVILHPWKSLKSLMPQSLFGRSLVILMMPLIMVQIVLGYIFFDRHTETILRTLSQNIAGEITLIVNSIENDPKNLKSIQKFADNNLFLETNFKPDVKLSQAGMKKKHWLYRILNKALKSQLPYKYYLHMDSDTIFVEVETKSGVVCISTLRKRLFSRTTPLVIIWTCVSALLLFLVAMLFMRNQIRPLQRLSEAAERFGKGDMSVAIKSEGASEIRATTQAFKGMQESIKKLLEERTLMLAGISHDLRTVLTRMKLSLHLPISKTSKADLKEDVDSMQTMIEGFLNYARDMQDEPSGQFDLIKVVKGIVDKFKKQAHISFTGEKIVNFTGKKTLINRCLTNLVLNSLKHASHIWVTVRVENDLIKIFVDDNGPGIPTEMRAEVFKPFYRMDDSRNQDISGSGLGLTIAQQAVLSHGGKIILSESPQKGLRVEVSIPSTYQS